MGFDMSRSLVGW